MRISADILIFRPLALVVTVGALLLAVPSQAQTFDSRFPVCMHVYSGASGGGGEWYDCSFTSLSQCRATASGQAATCDLNPYYPVSGRPSRPRHRRTG
ncbi:DUF3551 domain-containing protein [Bradyrhizobium sp. GCM10027634]|uniref:DUF3551 domain-containing protein n=1 Tax=unclassified Bradyrhizobium TaxID=2631580 RepID=UPI00188A2415|nr:MULTISPECIES: DUF3551 domain-containing protein [unclassified Bradyrhizobium]MDN5003492.1 DUF3551 domain-containing protein [Bradyrhizobium sp. WYCCWR 12677]QOZ47950.1 hypothetical protein XH89_34055 [Bradyrhizobium sp. CCBAU 53340]